MGVSDLPRVDPAGLEDNRIFRLLRSLGLVDADSLVEMYPRVRDRDDIAVLRCSRSGVIFLSRSDHIDIHHYVEKDVNPDLVSGTGIAHPRPVDDDRRRAEQIRSLVGDRRWLDIGTGRGGILDLLGPEARSYAAVEPNAGLRRTARDGGHEVFASVDDVRSGAFDVVTLFHVFEHLVDPIDMLRRIKEQLAPGGKVWLEVPHARDFLIETLRCRAFMGFTFWSEHLLLHTRRSLEVFLSEGGFADFTISAFQRYPISNHLYWLAKGAPGGHDHWTLLNDGGLSSAYGSTLARLDQTDTLVAVASDGQG